MKKLIALIALSLLAGCSSANLTDVKDNSHAVLRQAGFEIIGYEGYQLGLYMFGSSYGGAKVWYTLTRPMTPNVTYHAMIQRWGSEYHIYNLSAIDAIQPK